MNEPLCVVLIPGFMLNDVLWDNFIPELPSEWHIVKANLLQGDTIADMAINIANKLPKKFVIIGFSLGGYIARSLAEQFSDRTLALILIASSIRPDTLEQQQYKINAIKHYSKENFRGLSSISISKTLHPSNINKKELIKKIQDMSVTLGYEAFVKQSLLKRDGIQGSTIKCCTLIIYGDHDQIRLPDETMELHQHIVGSDVSLVQNTGHMIPIEQPKLLAQIILIWLKKQSLI